MSRENVELVRSIYAVWERGDYSDTEWAHPEIEFVIADGPEPGASKGLPGMAERWRDWLSVWQDARPLAEEYHELDEERVLVVQRNLARGKTSGIGMDQMPRTAVVFDISDGKVIRLVIHLAGERALSDLGLAS
jgi:ketosteroid isomerase-like protein